jgi:inner membrane protein involved in colicin E2 resistance
MKKLLLAVLLSTSALAESPADGVSCQTTINSDLVTGVKKIDTDVPKHLRGAVIIVRTADGRESTVPAEKFKVVPRKQQFITTETLTASVTQCTEVQVDTVYVKKGYNRVSLLAGKGMRAGLDKNRKNEETIEVKNRVGAVGGLMYQRIIDQSLTPLDLSVGGQVQTNKTILFNVGLDF